MNFKDFKSGTHKQQDQYKSFSPAPIDHAWVWDDPQINVLIEEATKSLGELNGFSRIVSGHHYEYIFNHKRTPNR